MSRLIVPGKGPNSNTELGALNKIVGKLNSLDQTVISTSSTTLAEQQAQTLILQDIDDNTLRSNLKTLQESANDLVTTFNYADAETADERVTSIIYSSVVLGLTVTKTFSYGGGSGTYYVTSTTLS